MQLRAVITFTHGGIREDMETREFLFSCSPLICVCDECGMVMEIKKHNLQPAVGCGGPIPLDAFESAIQIWDAKLE